MVFSSPIFLFLFLPGFLLLYFLTPKSYRNWILFIFSILFYSWGEKEIVCIMLASTVIDFYCAKFIERGNKQIGLAISILSNLGFLFFFKYFNFTFDNFEMLLDFFQIESSYIKNLPIIALPIGISFYTFQTLSYTIDVYQQKTKANTKFIEFATYVTMFPQLVAGPIVRYTDIVQEIKSRDVNITGFSIGVERFIVGLAKKVLIANTFAYIADEIFSLPNYALTTEIAWLGAIAYSFQIYYDFSGYSDMAIGLGKMLGFNIPENFNYPYISKSIKEFWRRWHISLSSWFRDYLYIPLGGNKKGKVRTYVNLFIVFLVTGLWHGASWNFIVWGLFHGFFLIIERLGLEKTLKKIWEPIQNLYVLLIICVGWVFFRADNLSQAFIYLKAMFGYDSGNNIVDVFIYLNLEVYIVFFLAIVFSTPVYKNVREQIDLITFPYKFVFVRGTLTISLFLLFSASIIYVAASSYNPFIYFRF